MVAVQSIIVAKMRTMAVLQAPGDPRGTGHASKHFVARTGFSRSVCCSLLRPAVMPTLLKSARRLSTL